MVGTPGFWARFDQILARFWSDFGQILTRFFRRNTVYSPTGTEKYCFTVLQGRRNTVLQYYRDGEIQFYSTTGAEKCSFTVLLYYFKTNITVWYGTKKAGFVSWFLGSAFFKVEICGIFGGFEGWFLEVFWRRLGRFSIQFWRFLKGVSGIFFRYLLKDIFF